MDIIRAKIRNLLGDDLTSGSFIETYEASSVFTLPEANVSTVSAVYTNDVESGTTYSFDTSTNKVTVTSSLTAGDTVQIDYTYYPNYSTTELTNYVKAALVHLSVNNYYEFDYDTDDDTIYPEPESNERNLIALIAATLIDPPLKSLRLPDITLTGLEDMSVDKKIGYYIARFKRGSSHGVFDILN